MIGNLETVTAGKERGYTGYPLFNTPDEYIEALKYSGFDLLVTANNHSLDKGKKGLLRTIKKIEEQGLVNTGTYRSEEERDSIAIFSVDSIKFTVLAYSYSTNGIPVPKGEDFLVNLIDTTLIRGDIERAKQEDLDLIIIFYHFGNEYKTSPSAYQEEVVNKTIKYGADIIIGSHPHVVQPVRFFKTNNGNLDTGFVAYSLGNFVSNQRWRYSDGGPILNLSITKDFEKDSVFISNVKIVPTWVFKGKTERGNEYIILPSDSILAKGQYSFLTEEDRINLVQNYFDTKNVMLKESPPVSVYSPSEELRIYLKNLIPFN